MGLRNLHSPVCFLVLVLAAILAAILAISDLLCLVDRLWRLKLDAQRSLPLDLASSDALWAQPLIELLGCKTDTSNYNTMRLARRSALRRPSQSSARVRGAEEQ